MELNMLKGLSKGLTLITILLFSIQSFAGIIKGKVLDAKTGEPLVGATILLEGGGKKLSTSANLDGSYILKNVPVGNYSIKIIYSGYKTSEVSTIKIKTANEVVVFGKNLEEDINQLTEVQVKSGGKETDNAARRLEKNSDVIQNILSQKAIELSPDVTVGNALQRMSGVNVQRTSNGEARHAIIRGMDQRYSNVLINGIKIPSPDDRYRYVPLNLFPADLLERLEVVKSITPNMEADAIAGSMNLVMKSAPSKFLFNVYGAGGYNFLLNDRPFYTFNHSVIDKKAPSETIGYGPNDTITQNNFSRENLKHTKKENPININAGFTIGNRFFKNKSLGVILGVSYQDVYQGSNTFFLQANAQPSPDPAANTPIFSDAFQRRYSTQDKRFAVNNKFDYNINSKNKISLYNFFVRMDQFEARDLIDTLIGSTGAGNRIGPGSGTITNQYISLWQIQTICNSTLAGTHQLSKKLSFDWKAAYSVAKQNKPDQADFSYYYVDSLGTVTTDSIANGMNRKFEHNSDIDKSLYANFIYTPTIAHRKVEIMAGGMFRHKDRENYFSSYNFSSKVGSKLQQWTNVDSTQYNFSGSSNSFDKGSPINAKSYTSSEEVTAGYMQAKFMLTTKLQVLTGVRIEHTESYYTTAITDSMFQFKNGHIWYTDVLPGLHLKYALNDKTNLRLSYYKAISRPSFIDYIPYGTVNYSNDYYSEQGNPFIKHTTADNIDLRYEYFPSAVDQILAGVFYKTINNPIEAQFIREGPSKVVLQPSNLGTFTNVGFEMVFTKYLGKFGLSLNYTYTHSKVVTNKFNYYRDADSLGESHNLPISQTRPLQGQANHIGNCSLLYKDNKLGLDAQLAFVYTGEKLFLVSQYANNDYWELPFTQLDFSLQKRLAKHFTAYTKVTNLTNSMRRIVLKHSTDIYKSGSMYLPQQDYSDKILVQRDTYKTSFLVGIRYKF